VGEPWVPPRLTIPTFTWARLPRSPQQPAEERPREEKLRLGRDAAAVLPAQMEDLPAAGPEPGQDVLEVRHGAGRRPEHGVVEGAAARGEQAERDEATPDLEWPIRDVLVADPVAGHVQRRAEQQCERARADERAGRASHRHVERDDHSQMIAYAPAGMGFLDSLRKAIAGPVRVRGSAGEAAEVSTALHEEYDLHASTPQEGKQIEELSDDAAGAPAGAAPFATAPFVAPSIDIGPAREAEAEERGESLEAEIESEDAPPDPAP